ncbi:MAG: rod shape-determining protein [Patescibacteria group bacterium]|nr:rod shape-determining protein [Patescibacteria group bacterium]MDE2437887.1 rod shape-determining protein [Patescibacteria group bacterium]
MALFHNDLGIDLGTANSLVYMKGKGIVLDEPSVVAVNQKTGHVLAVGSEAKQMVGRTPSHITAVRPLINGVISDFEITQEMLRSFFKKAESNRVAGIFGKRNRVVIGVPCDLTEVERKAVEDASLNAGAKEVYLVEEPLAAAIGMRLPVHEPVGNVVIDIGGGTSDIAVISLGGIVNSVSLKVAGDRFNEDIIRYVRDKGKLLIGEPTAEDIKITIGSACDKDIEEQEMLIQGKDVTTGLPREGKIATHEVRLALQKSLDLLVTAAKNTIEKSPPELVGDLMDRGVYLSGGGSLLRGIDTLMEAELGVPIHITDDPLTTVARGTGIIIEHLDTLRPILLNERIPKSAIG